MDEPPGDQAKPEAATWLIDWLAHHDAACPVCAYALRGLQADRCPECGCSLSLGVTSDQLAPGPWLVAIISFALALGFDGVIALFLSAAILFEPPRSPAEFRTAATMLTGFYLLGGACLLGVIAISRRRRHWNRMPRARQRWVAAGIFLTVGLVHAAFGAFIALTL